MTPLSVAAAAGAVLAAEGGSGPRLGAGATAGAGCAAAVRAGPRLVASWAAGARYAARVEARPAASPGGRAPVCLLHGPSLLRLTLLDGRAAVTGAAVTLLILDDRGAEVLPPTGVAHDPMLPGTYAYAGSSELFPAAGAYVARWLAVAGGQTRPATLAFRVV